MCIPILLTVMKKYGHFWTSMIEANRLLQVKSVLLCNIFLNLYSLEYGFRFLKPFFNHKVKCDKQDEKRNAGTVRKLEVEVNRVQTQY